MAKRKKKSASKVPKPAHKRSEEEVRVALSAPAYSTRQCMVKKSSAMSSPAKYLVSPLNEEELDRVQVEECSEEDVEEEELHSDEEEDEQQPEFKFFHSRATVRAGMENNSRSGFLSPIVSKLAGDLPASVTLAEEDGLNSPEPVLGREDFVHRNSDSAVGVSPGMEINDGNGRGRVNDVIHAQYSALPSRGKGFATLGSPGATEEAMNTSPKTCTQPVCENYSTRIGTSNTDLASTYREVSDSETRSMGAGIDVDEQQANQGPQRQGEGHAESNLDSVIRGSELRSLNEDRREIRPGKDANAGSVTLSGRGKGPASIGPAQGAAEAGLSGNNASSRREGLITTEKGSSSHPSSRQNTPNEDHTLPHAGARASRISPANAPQLSGGQNGHVSAQWRDLFGDNRSAATCLKLSQYEAITEGGACTLFDRDSNSRFSENCLVGYIAGKSPGFKALNGVIANAWKCAATLTIHDSGWLIYKFDSERDKLEVLNGGPYLIYGRPLILKLMPKFFDFSEREMSLVPVWVKFPNLPLECWSVVNLSKIASALGRPIQCDRLTGSMDRLSYARVLVEVDIMKELKKSISVQLPNGSSLCQFVIYETLPTHCKHCRVLSHSTAGCKYRGKRDGQQEERQSVFERLGPLPASVETEAGFMFPEVAADDSRWEVVRGKRNQKRRGGTEVRAALVGAADTLPAAATDAAARQAAKGHSDSPSGNAVAPPPADFSDLEDPAVVCAFTNPADEQHVRLNPEINSVALGAVTSRDSGSLQGLAAASNVVPNMPNESVLVEIVDGAGRTGSAAEDASVATDAAIRSAAPQVNAEPDMRSASSRGNRAQIVKGSSARPPGSMPTVAANTVIGFTHPAGISEVNNSNFFSACVENEMRGGVICQGSLGSPIAGAARLGGQTLCFPEKGYDGQTVTVSDRMVSVQIGGVSTHRAESSKGAGDHRAVGQGREEGMLTRSGRRRSRGGGKSLTPSSAA